MSLKFDDNQPKILSDIYSDVKESSSPHVEIFENQAYSTHSKSKANPAAPHDDVLGTKTAPSKEKSKKD